MTRSDVTFLSAGARCAGWLYRPADTDGAVPCVVMAHGFGLTRHDNLTLYAEALTRAGAAVLVYDHRYLGDSEGEPRQRVRISEHLADRLAAIEFARTLDGIDPDRIIVWGYSMSGGTAVAAAAADGRVAGAILVCPFLDARSRINRSIRTQPRNMAWTAGRAIRDAMIPVAGEPGGRGAMTFPGEFDGFRAVAAPSWRNEVRAGLFFGMLIWRPLVRARKLKCPVLIQAGQRDITVSARAIDQFARQVSRAVLKRYDVDHFEPFYGDHPARIIADQVDWLTATILAPHGPGRSETPLRVQPPNRQETTTPMTASDLRERREAIVNRHVEAENQHDIEATIATFERPRYEMNGVTHDGADAVRELHKTLTGALPDLCASVDRLRHTDDAVIIEARIIGTHDGEWNGIPPTGRRLEFTGVGIFEFEDDRLVCEKVFYDTAAVLAQMGVLPAQA
ncbi:MAG TPA: alpha/beta fold hydrolase [Mycobacterium sp.]|nr:alpha/beta fold hydrolase [Mycobacterium sp.]